MTTRAVHWHEGMFIRPQHFQTAQRYWAHLVDRSGKWDVHYNWGLRSVELDPDALGNYRGRVRSLKARLRDGTLVAIPEDGLLPEIDLKDAFLDGSTATLFLAIPVLHLGRVLSEGTMEEVQNDSRVIDVYLGHGKRKVA